jgi:hypothetical protein
VTLSVISSNSAIDIHLRKGNNQACENTLSVFSCTIKLPFPPKHKTPAHSASGTARRSVIFSAFAFTLLSFPRPAHEAPRIQGTPSRADGLRRYALSFVAVCFLPSCL